MAACWCGLGLEVVARSETALQSTFIPLLDFQLYQTQEGFPGREHALSSRMLIIIGICGPHPGIDHVVQYCWIR